MAELTLALVGLNRVTASMGLALKRYMKKGGKHHFTVIGHDLSKETMKEAQAMGAIDSSEGRFENAVGEADLVVVNLSYDQMEATYKLLRTDLRDGAVVLDMSPLKSKPLAWAKQHLTDEQHLIGITPVLNPRYIYEAREDLARAEEDLFDDSAILLSPSSQALKEAVDLAFNFCQIIGSRPRFLDPHEHDTLLAQTNEIPQLLGVTLFYHLMNRKNWQDLKWLTNPAFGVLTRPLFDIHPDAMRDEWHQNHDVLVRALDQYIATLQEMRDAIATGDINAIEAVTTDAAQEYETWINDRYRANWDAATRPAQSKPTGGMLESLLGEKLAKRISGRDDDDDK